MRLLRPFVPLAVSIALVLLALPLTYAIGVRIASADTIAVTLPAVVLEHAGDDPVLRYVGLRLATAEIGTMLAAADAGSGSGSGSGSAASSPALPTADQLHDPLTNPILAYDDARTLKTGGWALALLGGLVMVSKGLAGANAKWPNSSLLSWLAKGKTAVIVAGVAALAIAAFNALVLGGGWAAALIAAGGVALTVIHPVTPAKPPSSSS